MKYAMVVSVFVMLIWTSGANGTQECALDVNLTTPSSRFQINSDATVTDLWSQRTWLRCPLGWSLDDRGTPNFIDDVCVADDSDLYDIEAALTAVDALNSGSFAGASSWRIANIEELQSITERACQNPSMNLTVFPGQAIGLVIAANISGRGHPIAYDFADGESNPFGLGGIIGEISSVTGIVRVLRD